MYYPYLRGKQYELLALKEFAAGTESPRYVWPVLEPVRDPNTNSAFGRAIADLIGRDMNFTVIVNPTVGDLSGDSAACQKVLAHLNESPSDSSPFRLGVILDGTSMLGAARSIMEAGWANLPTDLFYPVPTPPVDEVKSVAGLLTLGRHVASGKDIVRRYRSVLPQDPPVVRFLDRFPSRSTNLAYVSATESVFSDDHAFYQQDGFVGFGDYLTIGEGYSEGGSSPRAVVIHFTYQDDRTGDVLIRHFASDTNADTSDTASKFSEAVGKLVVFCIERGLSNPAIDAFTTYSASGHYPGLGMIKKLSILNHLYLVNGILASSTP